MSHSALWQIFTLLYHSLALLFQIFTIEHPAIHHGFDHKWTY